jgi:cytochrome oxidase Cu insertion factor (SCO1/SenC/PrrC family)
MADTQEAPQPAVPTLPQGSIREAQEAFLSLAVPEEDTPKKKEAETSEEVEDVEESTEVEEEPLEASEEESDEELQAEEEDSEESEVEEEITEEEDDTPGLYTVKVNGEEVEVTEEELLKGYSRQQDYTKKTQELSEYRRQLDEAGQFYQEEVAKTQQARQEYINSLANAAQLNLASLQEYEKIDWERLKAEDKEEYLTKRDEYREAQSHIKNLQQTYIEENQKQAQEQQYQFNQWAQEEYNKLVKLIPAWGVPEQQKAIAGRLRNFANSKGFNDEEVKQLFDHRSILILMQAMAWEDEQNKAKVVKSGKGIEKSASNKVVRQKKMKRLQQSGHVNDAVGLFEDFVEL